MVGRKRGAGNRKKIKGRERKGETKYEVGLRESVCVCVSVKITRKCLKI